MQQSKNKTWRFFISLTCFILGIAAAWALVYHFISQEPKTTADTDKPKKDTMLIKLVDPLYPPAAVTQGKPDNVSTVTPLKKTAVVLQAKQNNEVKLSPQTGRTLVKNNPPAIDMALLEKKASALSGQSSLKNIFSPGVWFSLLIALLILVIAFFAKKEKLVNAQLTDKDPPELQSLFYEFRIQIGRFRNPRKILRFMNLVKYHYYFLSKNDWVTTANLKKMMLILLEIQEDPLLMSIEGVDTAKLSDPEWFYERIKEKPWYAGSVIDEQDNDLMMLILKLNIDMGS